MSWLSKTAAGPALAARVIRQAMEYAEYGGALGPLLEDYAAAGNYRGRDAEWRRAFALGIMNSVCETYGVEYIASKQDNWTDGAAGLAYLNTGDPYTATVIYDLRSGSWRIDNCGDIIERDNGRRFE